MVSDKTLSKSVPVRGSKIVVTGGGGFIGGHVVSGLCALGAQKVTVIDSLEYGNTLNLDFSDPRVELVQFTIGTDSLERIKPYFTDADILIHLAAQKHNQSINNPHAVYLTNIVGTADLFELAGQAGIKKIIFSSSLYAYGKAALPAMSETDIPTPRTIYGISKLCGEQILSYYGEKYQFSYLSFRFFFVYGPKQYPGMGYKSVIVKNFERLLDGKPAVIYGDGRQSLDYIYVSDVVHALVLGVESECSNEVFNVGSGEKTSILDLTNRMLAISGVSQNIEFTAPDWTAGTVRISNSAKIKDQLNWSPTTSLTSGLERTFNWLKNKSYGN